jgi:hypothetical protein
MKQFNRPMQCNAIRATASLEPDAIGTTFKHFISVLYVRRRFVKDDTVIGSFFTTEMQKSIQQTPQALYHLNKEQMLRSNSCLGP